ncbi:hypothetical protein FOZ60_007278 [Perkinsus olseni]|uniref:Tyr recombinase domain-containing protein n=1 Tax=Perkinsus olseni TaxID=32597 RepID=A0A7J6NLR4_PEROL|nr:hypothetical protein FOZ60_007278 [Perkinsus olseni]
MVGLRSGRSSLANDYNVNIRSLGPAHVPPRATSTRVTTPTIWTSGLLTFNTVPKIDPTYLTPFEVTLCGLTLALPLLVDCGTWFRMDPRLRLFVRSGRSYFDVQDNATITSQMVDDEHLTEEYVISTLGELLRWAVVEGFLSALRCWDVSTTYYVLGVPTLPNDANLNARTCQRIPMSVHYAYLRLLGQTELSTPHSGRKNSSTAVLLGVAACLRPGELADLREEDIKYDPKTRALYVNVREGKTDVEKQGEIVVVGCCCGPQQPESSHLCPVHRTLRLLQEGVGMRDHTNTRSIFGCSRGELDADIKNILRVVTGSSARATSHALRRSGVQLLAEQGVSAQEIADHGRWRSTSTVLNTYLRQSSSYEQKAQTYPAKMLGLVQRDLTRATSATDPKPQPPYTRAAMRARPKRNPQSGAGANPKQYRRPRRPLVLQTSEEVALWGEANIPEFPL